MHLRSMGFIRAGAAGLLALAGHASSQPAPDPSRSRLLQHYAETFGVPVAEAERRQHNRWEIVDLGRRLETEEPETFAGLWIEHSPVYRVVARFTRAPEEILRRYTRNPLFVAGPAPVSKKALLLDHERAMAAMRPTGLRYASKPEMLTGLIEIIAEDPEAVERLRAAGKLDLPPNTIIKKAAGPFPEPPPSR